MKRFFWGGLTVAFGCIIGSLNAEEVKWQRAGANSKSSPAPRATAVNGRRPIASNQPELLQPGAMGRQSARVVPATFTEHTGAVKPMRLSGQKKDTPAPLPVGDPMDQTPPPPAGKNGKPDVIPLPPPISAPAGQLPPTINEPPMIGVPGPGTGPAPAPGPGPGCAAPPATHPVGPHCGPNLVTEPDWSCCNDHCANQCAPDCAPAAGCATGCGRGCLLPNLFGCMFHKGQCGHDSCYGDCCGGDDCCGDGCCGDDCGTWAHYGCCQLPQFWASAEMLMWGVKHGDLPALVTQNTLSNAQFLALVALGPTGYRQGALGEPGTEVIFGDGVNDSMPTFTGGRFTVGWSRPCRDCGFEVSYFFLGEESRNFVASSNGFPRLYRPFFNVNPAIAGNPREDAQLVAVDPLLAGSVTIENPTRLFGFEANFRKPWKCGCNWKLDWLAGFRFLQVDESLSIRENLTFNQDFIIGGQQIASAGDNIIVQDNFTTRNRFYGGQVGLDFEYRKGRWIFGVQGKLAVGSIYQEVSINGATTVTPRGGQSVTGAGGLLAQPTNIGTYTRNRIAFAPEVGLKVGYQLNDQLSVHVGYNFLYISDVARPGDQIDRVVNTSQLPRGGVNGTLVGAARPVFIFQDTSFWAQGLTAGLKYQY